MDVHVPGLAALDPLAVPLPNGTEVTTRADRVLEDGRTVPRGAVGRVVATHGDEIEVEVVGIGRVRYLRRELAPRKLGQLRFAYRREMAWTALLPCAVLEAVVGSRAWGLADEQSDTDRRGIFLLPFPWHAGLAEPPRDLVSADGSSVYWEVGKAVRQALRADPNTLELLFVGSARPLDPMGEWLLAARDAFVSAELYGSFGRYALSQLKRLERALRLAEHRTVVLDWLRVDPVPSLDEVATRLASAVGKSHALTRQYVQNLYSSLYDQGLLTTRDFGSLVRYARTADPGFELPRDLRPKNAYNLIRLIATAIGWLRTGAPELRIEGSMRDTLLAIKQGSIPLADVLRLAEQLTPELEAARRETRLPARPDLGRADTVLRRIREEAARRWITREPGPWGRDAPPAPAVGWQDPDYPSARE